MLLEGFEIAVVVQQGKAALDAKGGDQAIYGGANGDALLAQMPIVGGCQNREGFVAQYRAGQAINGGNDRLRLLVSTHALQNFLKNKIGYCNLVFSILKQIAQVQAV